MTRLARVRARALACALAAASALIACTDASRTNPLPSLRLAPAAAVSDGVADPATLVDRDTSRAVALAAPARVTLRFDHAVEIRRVKVHAAPGVRVTGPGVELASAGGWSAAALAHPVTATELTLELTPPAGGGSVAELEVWGAGLPRAPRDLRAVAVASASGGYSAEDVRVGRASPSDLVLHAPGAASGEPCASATIDAPLARQARRAFLVYEAELARAISLRRSLNGAPPQGGFWAGNAGESTLVDELDPEALERTNGVLLCAPLDASASVTVRNVRLVLLLDAGDAPVDRDTASRLGAAVDGDPATSASVRAGPLTVSLDRAVAVESAEAAAPAPVRLEALDVFDGVGWSTRAPAGLAAGATPLPLAGASVQAFRMTFGGPARDVPVGSLSEVSLSGSGVGPRVGAARIVVTYPPLRPQDDADVGERFGDRAYVAGWAESPAGRGAVEVDGVRADTAGAFGVPLERPAGTEGPWTVVLRARFPDGAEVVRTIRLDDDRGATDASAAVALAGSDDQRYGSENQEATGSVDAERGGTVRLGSEVSVDVPPGAVKRATTLSVTRKGSESVPRLDGGMVNVTAPANGAYRFLPKGQQFAKPVRVTLPYDPSLLPEGVGPDEVHTWFFDEARERWTQLPRAELQASARRVVSETTHFTFMINAVLVLPEHPGPVSFDPTSIKDLKAAEPAAEMDLVRPPEGNAMGSAQLAFPIRLPPARGAHQPALRLAYDSAAGNGWAGIGWDLAVPSVQIDTRFGVPDPEAEPRYLLAGEEIVPAGTTARCEGTSAPGDLYVERVAREFSRIVRCGVAPSRWFEVADRHGTLFVYGYGIGARLRSPRPGGAVAAWYLERVVDANGNLTLYQYESDSWQLADAARHGERFRQVYLRSIRFTGRASREGAGAVAGGTPGPYVVDVEHLTRDGALVERADPITSGRLGFKLLTRRLLGKIRVSLGTAPIREYVLGYGTGSFGKSVLESVATYGFDGTTPVLFHEHGFEYEKLDARKADGKVHAFGEAPVRWRFDESAGADVAQFHHALEDGSAKQGGLSFGIPGVFSIGGNKGKTSSDTYGQFLFADVNGDGLPDRLRGGPQGAVVAFNAGRGAGDGSFSAALPPGDPNAGADPGPIPVGLGTDHGKGEIENYSAGFFGIGASEGSSSFSSAQTSMLQDVDGDGFVDWAAGGTVLRGQPRSELSRGISFRPWSGPGFASDSRKPGWFTDLIEELVDESRRPSDAVLEWIAPFSGQVDVTGALALVDRPLPPFDSDWDGVRLRIYRADEADGAFVTEQLAEAWTSVAQIGMPVPVGVEAVGVEPGTRLYFVLSTLGNFPVNVGARTPVEEAEFSPRIVYRGVAAAERDRVDPTGAPEYVFDASQDFRLAGGGVQAQIAPVEGRVRIESTVVKAPTTANVRACIQRFPEGALQLDVPCGGTGFALVASREYGGAVARTEALDVETDVLARDRLVFRIETNLSFDPRAIEWRIEGHLTQVKGDDGELHPPHPSMALAAAFTADPFVPLHVSIDPTPIAEGRWSAVPDALPLLPLVVPEDGELRITTRQDDLSGPGDAVWLAARTKDALVFEQSAADPPQVVTVSVTAGQELFFELHSHQGSDVGWAPTVTLVPASGAAARDLALVSEVPLNRTRDTTLDEVGEPQQIRSPFAGGYHGWRYGAWHGENAAPFDPNGMIVLLPFLRGGLWDALARRLADSGSLEAQAVAATSPLFPRRLGTFAGGTRWGIRGGVPAWVSLERSTFVTATTMHGSREYVVREGPDALALLSLFSKQGALRASGGSNSMVGFNVFGLAGVNRTVGSSGQWGDLVDMNGDGLLDRVGHRLEIKGWRNWSFYSEVSTTGLNDLAPRPAVRVNVPILRTNTDVGGTANLGKSMAIAKLSSDDSTVNAVVGSQTATFGIGASLGVNLSSSNNELIDVNGDGLPDLVTHPSTCPLPAGPCFAVRLNLGNGEFGNTDALPVQPWGDGIDTIWRVLGDSDVDPAAYGPDRVRRTTAATLKSSVGITFIYGRSKSWESSIAQTSVQLVDVTGDGLPDYVRKGWGDGDLRVMVNTGAGFLPDVRWYMPPWPGGVTQPFLSGEGLFGGVFDLFDAATGGIRRVDAVEANGSWTPEATEGWGVDVTVPIGPFALSGNYGEEESTRITGVQLGMMDIDGDGVADHVLKAEDRDDGTSNLDVYARQNQLGKANLLTRVRRPLGGKIDLAYASAGHTVGMPKHRWVLSDVIVRDGLGTDARDRTVEGHDVPTHYEYESGRYDRYEREFLGFGTVRRVDADGSRVVRTFRNDRYAFKGLRTSERVETAALAPVVETVDVYRDPYLEPDFRLLAGTADCEALRPFSLGEDDYFCGSLFPALKETRKRLYEGGAVARIETLQSFTYDPATGNVVGFDDLGDVAAGARGDDLHATISWFDDDLAKGIHSIARAQEVVITDAGGARLRRREAKYDERGNLHRFIAWTDASTSADTFLHWDELGLLVKVEGPAVAAGRYTLDYGYDDVVHTFRRTVADSHGYGSTTEWDYGHALPTDTTDENGQKTHRVYDALGRLKELYGPYDAANPEVRVDYVAGPGVAYARSRHRTPEGRTLDTLVFQDGIGRVVQTKKTAEVEGKGIGWAASGHVQFDAVGRLAAQGQGYFEAGAGTAYRFAPPLYPQRFAYDALGRTTWTEQIIERTPAHEDGKATTLLAYGFGTAGTPLLRLAATVTDPEGKVRVLFRDPANRVVGVEERDEGVPAVTRYVHDPLGALTDVYDARGNRTRIAYDELGRRTSIDSLDAGLTQYEYDAAGYPKRKINARNEVIAYTYVFDQLRAIDYPGSKDVSYEYGKSGAAENGAGRVVRVTDAAGSETRGYGPLGELVRSTRTVAAFRNGDGDKVFETRFAYDAFGRMRWILYPDGEKVTYGYDAGGLLASATGSREAGADDPVATEAYLKSLTYDELGQRRTMALGNGATTTYDYYPESRRLRGLATAAAGRKLQAMAYEYDRIGNVLELSNALPAATGSRSGPTHVSLRYDDLHRLTSATGTAESRPGVVDSFVATYDYDELHDLTRNKQVHVVKTTGLPGEGVGYPPDTNHDLDYEYSPRKPHQATRIGDTFLVYDAAGNVESQCQGSPGCGAGANHLRRLYWNEENRLDAVVDGNGENVTRFVYDAAGERVAKLGRGGESLSIGQFFALKGRKAASKHVFAGTERIATKVSPPPGWQPADPDALATQPGEPPSGSTAPGCVPSDYQPSKCDAYPGGDPVVLGSSTTKIRPSTYYYHPDHLGSTSWVTDQDGRVHEHVEYFPYGQVWRDVRSDADRTTLPDQRFLFTSKELDEETGLYYFGARYYDPKRAHWASADPIEGVIDRLERNGDRPQELALFAYVHGNPYAYVDPSGRQPALKLGPEEVATAARVAPRLVVIAGGAATGAKAAGLGWAGGTMLVWAGGAALAGAGGWMAGTWLNKYVSDPIQIAADYWFGPADNRYWSKPSAAPTPTASKSSTYSRPHDFRAGVRDEVWEDWIEASTGRVRDPLTGRFMSKDKPWDMGHLPGYEFRKHQQSSEERGIDRGQFLNEYNDPSIYRPELPASNRSHRGENLTEEYFGK